MDYATFKAWREANYNNYNNYNNSYNSYNYNNSYKAYNNLYNYNNNFSSVATVSLNSDSIFNKLFSWGKGAISGLSGYARFGMNALTTAGKKFCSLLGFGTSIYGNYVDHMDDIQQVCSQNPYTIDCGWAMIKPAVSGVAGATAGALCGAGAGYLTSQVGGVAFAPAAAMAAGTYCYDLAENYVDGLLYQMEDNNFIN